MQIIQRLHWIRLQILEDSEHRSLSNPLSVCFLNHPQFWGHFERHKGEMKNYPRTTWEESAEGKEGAALAAAEKLQCALAVILEVTSVFELSSAVPPRSCSIHDQAEGHDWVGVLADELSVLKSTISKMPDGLV
jgi:hypothetical protein